MRSVRLLAAVTLLLPTLAQAQVYYYPAPTTGISRASFVQMVMSQTGTPADGTDCFADVKKQSYAPSVCGAKQRGFVTGDPSSKFRPDDAITFIEAAAIVVRAYGIHPPSNTLWYRPYLEQLELWYAIPASVTNILYPINNAQAQELISNVFSADHSRTGTSGGSSSSSGSKSDTDDDGDIHLTLKASDSSADTGDTVTYTITVRNDDDRDLNNLEIRAYIDQDLDFVSATDGGDYSSDRVEWDDIDVDEDESETITLKLRVSGSADDGDKLHVRVRVEDAETELRLTVDEDDDDDDNENDDNDGDFSISISDSPSTAEPGDDVTYTIRLRNEDNEDIRVDVRAELDDDMEFISASDGGDEDDDEVEWDNILVEEDEEETLTLRVRIDNNADDGDTVRLEVSAEGEEDTETTNIEEDYSSNDDDDISITISDSPDPAEIGEIVMYTIRVENHSDENREIDIVAEMDEGMTIYTSSDASERNGKSIYWRDLEVARDSVRTINMKVTINVAADEGEEEVLKVRAGTIHEEERTMIED